MVVTAACLLWSSRPVMSAILRLLSVLTCVAWWTKLLRRRLLGRQKDARICDMQDNVKQGDHLRTLGGAMTALKYCICCSARDYPKIWVSYHSSGNVFSWSPQRGLSGSYLIRRLEYFSVYKLIRVVSL